MELGGTSERTTGTRAHTRVLAHRDVAKNIRIVSDEYAVAHGGVPFAVTLAGSAQRYALIDGDITTHNGRLPNHDAGGMVDESLRPISAPG